MFNTRFITTADAQAALNVYAPYVRHTANTFEYDVPALADFVKKIETITAKYPWLVCEYDGKVIGYVYASTHRDRAAYQWSPEATVYIDERFHRLGIARILYEALFNMLRIQGYFNIYAGVLATNTKSCEFHKALGFQEIGIYKNVGYKLGEWRSNLWLQLQLAEHISEPPVPLPFKTISDADKCMDIMRTANEKLNNISSIMQTH